MIANARMYSVLPSFGKLWRSLFEAIAAQASVPLTWVEHPEPAPMGEIWCRQDKGAVFMCGLPYARSEPRPVPVAAPVPSPTGFEGRPEYWSDLVVRAGSAFRSIEDTFGHRIAFTTMDSQSGCHAALYHLMAHGERGPLYKEVIAPRVTPLGALTAVLDGLADVAPIDSFALSLLQKACPERTSQLRIVARTAPTPIPPIVASQPVSLSLESAFLEAHENVSLQALMTNLQVDKFVRPDPVLYDVLKRRFDVATSFWRGRPFARSVHPAFAELATGPSSG
jgi:ABC-type phosphate/phosphonate transport system substrate-binding protein